MRRIVALASIAAILLAGGIAMAAQELKSFRDVPADHWAQPAIQFLVNNKIVQGRSAEEFAPNAPVTRAEVAQMIYKYDAWRKSRDNKLDHVNRGCPACHTLRQMGNRQMDLRLGALVSQIPGHEGVPATAGVDDCKSCHQPGGKAKLMLRTIVHPLHFNSAVFRENYRGNCFTCHDINADGKFVVLKKALEVNERGIPTESPFGPDGKELREDLR